MIPTSLAGLVLFVVLMTPGLVLVLRRERTVPARQISAFRETVRVVAASTGCLLLAGLLLTLLRALLPQATVDTSGHYFVTRPATQLTNMRGSPGGRSLGLLSRF